MQSINKRKTSKDIAEQVHRFSKMPESDPLRQEAEAVGYQYLEILVKDAKTGETIQGPYFTLRKQDDMEHLAADLYKITTWPLEIREWIQPKVMINGIVLSDGHKSLREMELSQGGRPRSTEWDSYYARWKDSGFDSTVFNSLRDEYSKSRDDDPAAYETFNSLMKRRKKADKNR